MAAARPLKELREIEIDRLHLDPLNPRLPEALRPQRGRVREADLLEYMVREEALTELAESFADNGFFKHEPLLVLERKEGDNEYFVVEGNRRLASLLVLLGLPVAKGLDLGVSLSPTRERELARVPCRELRHRADVDLFVGYRHIGGLKKWPAEAKARYVVEQIEKLVQNDDDDPFRTLGRRVGSNARPMRHSYVTLKLVHYAREEGDFNLQALLDERRFTVWLRAYDSPKIREYIRVQNGHEPISFQEVNEAIRRVDLERLLEVLGDLVPRGEEPPIMDDSRDMSVYAAVLMSERAREVLRKRRSLDEARILVTDEALALKIERLGRTAEHLLMEVHTTVPDDDLRDAAERYPFTGSSRDRVVA
jgi:hypothetical protein